jgi:hypothetical protein
MNVFLTSGPETFSREKGKDGLRAYVSSYGNGNSNLDYWRRQRFLSLGEKDGLILPAFCLVTNKLGKSLVFMQRFHGYGC